MNSKDFLIVELAEIPCRIGITDEERAFPQVLYISFKLGMSLKQAGETDDITHSIDYAEAVERARNVLMNRTFNLVEAAAEAIADIFLKTYQLNEVHVEVRKKVFPDVRWVGVSICRRKGSGL